MPSIVKHSVTNEIRTYHLSQSLKIDQVLDTLDIIKKSCHDKFHSKHIFIQIKVFTTLVRSFKRSLMKYVLNNQGFLRASVFSTLAGLLNANGVKSIFQDEDFRFFQDNLLNVNGIELMKSNFDMLMMLQFDFFCKSLFY
ncbi:MAG: hypothetical protein BGO41_11520 [Clostridiales bacterium 38-18]|nr:MAG: hypothetical protein BGO41_11520 [Clostridiales bacterium 38-18]